MIFGLICIFEIVGEFSSQPLTRGLVKELLSYLPSQYYSSLHSPEKFYIVNDYTTVNVSTSSLHNAISVTLSSSSNPCDWALTRSICCSSTLGRLQDHPELSSTRCLNREVQKLLYLGSVTHYVRSSAGAALRSLRVLLEKRHLDLNTQYHESWHLGYYNFKLPLEHSSSFGLKFDTWRKSRGGRYKVLVPL
ncbi:hypothetical protein N7G274_005640 [Stereocaulon virgatum]|uniref:Uncharacterized protein n=1 Tax=Stereocaulon virgatum TaxID=373712 RepID=A0ABR4A7S7_9LECA